ncbi:PqiB family protein [Atopomonas sediminilitoris]|uniref:PqiB family protein n=1 Tax=Atopomonas sediminilitoris TaxID=2919919 RepID=UPI001F4D389F|nr:MlaD family protein [Atopomonas sediminilitoris]MCJ8168761.1 MlaD family protein [Atopomonas sediminilitoris]
MTDNLPVPHKRKASTWSAIWVLPLIALGIGLWLAWRAYSTAGINVMIDFSTGDGIQVGKTELIYKGMALGKVKDLRLDKKHKGVRATLEVAREAEGFLRSNTRFWLVKPRVSLAGVTGLETLVSGNYITLEPGEGEFEDKFAALLEPPPLSDALPGLHLTVRTPRLGSLEQGAPIYYKQIQVGQVKDYELDQDEQNILVGLVIKPEYAHLVRQHTRFWNASGLEIEAGLSGVKINTESLVSVLAGGIAFATPDHRKDSPPVDAEKVFPLYENFEAAQSGIRIKLHVTEFAGLEPGETPVRWQGVQVGYVKKVAVDADLQGAMVELNMDPRTEDYMVEGTQFWMVRPSISLTGISGLEALFKGNYFVVRPGNKGDTPQREFEALRKPPPLDVRTPGLHVIVTTDKVGSLSAGSPILYRQLQVGTVNSVQLGPKQQKVVVGLHIEPEYVGLINKSTRFWNASGVTLKGGLSGIEVKAESLQSLLAGGIAFETPDKGSAVGNGARFNLYESQEQALAEGVLIELTAERGENLSVGMPLRYLGFDVGQIENIELASDLKSLKLTGRITESPAQFARAGAQYWLVSPKLGLVRTAHLETLVGGTYIEVSPPAKATGRQLAFNLLMDAPGVTERERGLRITVSTPRRASIKEGVSVTYREVAVGKVTGVHLAPNADRVLLELLIEPRYASLVTRGSKFWNVSGIGVDFSLFKGTKIRAESLESLVEGGIAFATPEGAAQKGQARDGEVFILHDEYKDEWLKWQPRIAIKR